MKTSERRLLMLLEITALAAFILILWADFSSIRDKVQQYEIDIAALTRDNSITPNRIESLKDEVNALMTTHATSSRSLSVPDYTDAVKKEIINSGLQIIRFSLLGNPFPNAVEFVVSGKPQNFSKALYALEGIDSTYTMTELTIKVQESDSTVESTIRIFKEAGN